MIFIKEQWDRFINFLRDVPWLRVIVVILMIACTVQICLWIRDTVDTNSRLKAAVDVAIKYAGQLEEENKKLGTEEIAHTIISTLKMRDKGFVPEVTVWATNPF